MQASISARTLSRHRESMPDFLASAVHIQSDPVTLPHIVAGKAQLLATLGRERCPDFPNVLLPQEIYPAMDFRVWFGIFAPPRTPQSIVAAMSYAMNKVASEPELRQNAVRNCKGAQSGHATGPSIASARRLRGVRSAYPPVQYKRAVALATRAQRLS